MFNVGKDTKHLLLVAHKLFLVGYGCGGGGFSMPTLTIKENKQELLLCLWLVFELKHKKGNLGRGKAALHFLSLCSEALRWLTLLHKERASSLPEQVH